MRNHKIAALVLCLTACAELDAVERGLDTETPWTMTTVQAGGPVGSDFRGADGMHLVGNEIAVPWEKSSKVTLSTFDGTGWTTTIVGTNGQAEEAILADVDRDGLLDVISGGEDKQLKVHYRNATGPFTTVTIASGTTSHRWMQLALVEVDEDPETVEIMAGGKRGSTGEASIRIYSSVNPRVASSWSFRTLGPVDWTMSMIPLDRTGDGRIDTVVVSDRKNYYGLKGARYLELAGGLWVNHPIGNAPGEYVFLHAVDFDADGDLDFLGGTQIEIHWHENLDGWSTWTTHVLPYPENVGTFHAATTCDVNGDGLRDMVLAFANAGVDAFGVDRSGVVAMLAPDWTRAEISGPAGEKFDVPTCVVGATMRVYTTEQLEQLGAILYEVP